MIRHLSYRLKNRSDGASVLAIVIIISVLTALGVVFSSLMTTGIEEESIGQVNSMRALYNAEAGAEAALGHLNTAPASTNWVWMSGYLDKSIGGGTVDVEVLQYDDYPAQTSVSPYCVTLSASLVNTSANPARTIFVELTKDPAVNADNLGVELYDTDLVALGTCASPGSTPVATSVTSDNPETIRYRVPEPGSFPSTVTYTVRVLGSTGLSHRLGISHPDMSGFTELNDTRSVISTGKSGDARREIFISFRRQPC